MTLVPAIALGAKALNLVPGVKKLEGKAEGVAHSIGHVFGYQSPEDKRTARIQGEFDKARAGDPAAYAALQHDATSSATEKSRALATRLLSKVTPPATTPAPTVGGVKVGTGQTVTSTPVSRALPGIHVAIDTDDSGGSVEVGDTTVTARRGGGGIPPIALVVLGYLAWKAIR